MAETFILERAAVILRGRRLEYFTVAWNSIEGLVAVATGVNAGSISLVGFGIDEEMLILDRTLGRHGVRLLRHENDLIRRRNSPLDVYFFKQPAKHAVDRDWEAIGDAIEHPFAYFDVLAAELVDFVINKGLWTLLENDAYLSLVAIFLTCAVS